MDGRNAANTIIPHQQHIDWIIVDKDSRRTGIGSLLMRRSIDLAANLGSHQITASIESGNDPSLKLFRGHGFTEIMDAATLEELQFNPHGLSVDIAVRKQLKS